MSLKQERLDRDKRRRNCHETDGTGQRPKRDVRVSNGSPGLRPKSPEAANGVDAEPHRSAPDGVDRGSGCLVGA